MKRKMIKFLSITLTMLMLVGCGKDNEVTEPDNKNQTIEVQNEIEPTKEPKETIDLKEENKEVEEDVKEDTSTEEKEDVQSIPTIEELFAANENGEEVCDMEMTMSIEVSSTYEENGTSIDMDMVMNSDMNILNDKDTTYTSGNVSISIMGMNFEQPMQMYVQKEDGYNLSYVYEPDMECWIYEEALEEEVNATELTDIMGMKEALDMTLNADISEDYYIVSAIVDYNKLNELYGDSFADLTSFGFDETSNMKINMDYKFNKSDMRLVELIFFLDTEIDGEALKQIGPDGEEIVIKVFEFAVKLNDVADENFEVTIPQDVVDNAKTIEEALNLIIDEY